MKRIVTLLWVLGLALWANAQAQRTTLHAAAAPSTSSLPVRDTLAPCISFQFDDNLRENMINGKWNVMRAFNIPISVGVIAWQVDDDTTTYNSRERLAWLKTYKITETLGDGTTVTKPFITWTGHGYGQDVWSSSPLIENQDLWNGDNSRMSRGEFTSMYWFEKDAKACFLSMRDTLGLGTPRGWITPNSSGFYPYSASILKYFDYIVAPTANATGTSSEKRRYNTPFEVIPLLSGNDPKVSAYPNVLPPRHEIPYHLGENLSWTTFRERCFEIFAVKGWGIFVGHTVSELENNTGQNIGTICAFLDSLRTEGMRYVSLDEGYDLFFNNEISPMANFAWSNFDDHNGDGNIDFINSELGADNITNYPDSVWLEGGSANHGVFGNGYATLDFSATESVVDIANVSDPRSWVQARDVQFVFPNFAPGELVLVEFWAQVDQSIEDVAGTPLSNADSVGVTFEALVVPAWNYEFTNLLEGSNAWSLGTGYLSGVLPSGGYGGGQGVSYRYKSTGSPYYPIGNYSRFEPGDTVGGDWCHVTANWRVPPAAHEIAINIVQDSRFDASSVRISNFFVGRAPRAR